MQLLTASEVARRVNQRYGTRYQAKHIWRLLEASGISPATAYGKRYITPQVLGKFYKVRDTGERPAPTNPTWTVVRDRPTVSETTVERNRAIIAAQEAAVRAGQLRPLVLPAASPERWSEDGEDLDRLAQMMGGR